MFNHQILAGSNPDQKLEEHVDGNQLHAYSYYIPSTCDSFNSNTECYMPLRIMIADKNGNRNASLKHQGNAY